MNIYEMFGNQMIYNTSGLDTQAYEWMKQQAYNQWAQGQLATQYCPPEAAVSFNSRERNRKLLLLEEP